MPLLDDERVHLFIILLLISLQFFVWNYIHSTQADAESDIYFKSNTFHILSYAKKMTVKLYQETIRYLYSIDIRNIFSVTLSMRPKPKPALITQPPKIIELHERKHVFFGASQKVREKRPYNLKFSIGQVVRHRYGFKAVVIGWDEFAAAPPSWMALHYPRFEREMEVRQQPNYRLLADFKDTLYQIGPIYAPEDELTLLTPDELKSAGSKLYPHEPIIHHSTISEFFDYFDGTKFSPRPWLRRIYPQG